MMLGYFLITLAIMVILIRWFILPTLQNSAFWKVCTTQRDALDSAYIQCVMGTTSLWLPILLTVLILNYVSLWSLKYYAEILTKFFSDRPRARLVYHWFSYGAIKRHW